MMRALVIMLSLSGAARAQETIQGGAAYTSRLKPLEPRTSYQSKEYSLFGHFSMESGDKNQRYTELLALTSVKIDLEMECPDKSLSKDSLREVEKAALDVQRAALCSESFGDQRAEWDRFTPPITEGVSRISLTQAKNYLLRFAKPGGYEAEKHKEILWAILGTPSVKEKLKKELFFAAQMLMLDSKRESATLSGYVTNPAPVPPFKEEDGCRSDSENEEIRKRAAKSALEFAGRYENSTASTKGHWESVILLIPSLNKLPEAQKTEIKNKMYRTLATGAVAYAYPGLFISKALLFTKNYVNKLFGDPSKDFTELVAIPGGGTVRYYLLGTSDLESEGVSSKPNMFGFNSIQLRGPAAPKIGEIKNLPVKWKHNDESYTGTIKVSSKKAEGLIKIEKKPDYQKMWEDKKLTGVVLVGDNLGEFKAKATEHYIQYYADQGFDFAEPQDLKDTEQWVKENVSNGNIDYVLKDAHAGGNTSNLISFSAQHKVLKGTREIAGGKTEEIYILAPGSDNHGPQQTLSYDNMKEWMNKREKDNKGPMIYLNSSCGSLEQAKYEVPAVESPLFVNIASSTTTTTFVNSPKATKYHIVEGIRNGQTYSEIRKGMAQTKRYQTGTNQFKFPDEKAFKDAFSKSTEVQVRIQDSTGKPYSFETAAAAH